MKKLYTIKLIMVPLLASLILFGAFWQNSWVTKIIISPFLICTLASLGRNLGLIFQKTKVVAIFQIIFQISFLIYIWGLLIYGIYYGIHNHSLSFLFFVGIFMILVIKFVNPKVFKKRVGRK